MMSHSSSVRSSNRVTNQGFQSYSISFTRHALADDCRSVLSAITAVRTAPSEKAKRISTYATHGLDDMKRFIVRDPV